MKYVTLSSYRGREADNQRPRGEQVRKPNSDSGEPGRVRLDPGVDGAAVQRGPEKEHRGRSG